MKPVLIALLVLLCTCVRAQKTKDAVQEVENADRYFFRVELEKGKAKQLMECTNELTDGNVGLKKRGRLLPYSIDEHTELAVNVRRRLLTIEHHGNEPAERERTKAVAARAKACLNVAAPDAPRLTKRSSRSVEIDGDTHYSYSLQDNKINARDLIQAYAAVVGQTINGGFSGDWSTYLSTRRNRISIDYQGDDVAVRERAKEKAAALRTRLRITPDTSETPDERSDQRRKL